MTFFISRKRYSIGEVLKCIFFRNPGIAKVLAVERDVKPRNMNFANVDRRGGTNREGALIRINTVYPNFPEIILYATLYSGFLHDVKIEIKINQRDGNYRRLIQVKGRHTFK